MKRVLIYLVLRHSYENSYAWQSAGDIVKYAKKHSMPSSLLNIISYI